MNNVKEKSTRLMMKEMEVGEVLVFPLDRYSSIKSATSTYGLEWNRKYQIESNREDRTMKVTRIS